VGSVLKGPLADEPESSVEDVLSALQEVDEDELDVADVAVLQLDQVSMTGRRLKNQRCKFGCKPSRRARRKTWK
jgi:hypothetical protein